MKKFLFILIMYIGCATTVMAQRGLSVKSFNLVENDQDARVAYKREDANGRLAALIKVQTIDQKLSFSTGVSGIVGDVVYKPGEVWVYVPRNIRKFIIGHNNGKVEYPIDIKIDGGCVYELVLDLGIGRFMNISASEPGATIFLDNDSLGVSPIAQRYVLYGFHRIKAEYGYWEGEVAINVTDDTPENLTIQMTNIQSKYHHVTLSTEKGVQILRDGQVIGADTWEGTLREGTYIFTTHRENYEDAETTIEVGNGNRNMFTLNKPKPVFGFLKLHVTPVRATVTTTDNRQLSHRDVISLPVGRHHLTFKASGFLSQDDVPFDIKANQTQEKTIHLKPIDYVKPTSFYIGGGYTYASLMGISATAGMTLFNFDVQLTYTLGLAATNDLSWYTESNNAFYSKMNYKMNTFAARLGYQIRLSNRLAVTPQIGYAAQSLVGNTVEGAGTLGNGASATCFTIGAKLVIIPAHHFGIFIMPEFGLSGKETDAFKAIADKGSFNAGGLMATGGLFLNF